MAVGLCANQLINKVLQLLREETYAQDPMQAPNIPNPADFSYAGILSDLNYGQQIFMGDTGLTGRLIEKMVSLPVVAGLDYTMPTDMAALTRMEYFSGSLSSGPVVLREKSFDEFDYATGGGYSLSDVGFPKYYRTLFGSGANVTTRFWPQPGYGNAGLASNTLQIAGTPTTGNTLTATFHNGTTAVVVGPYTVLPTDNLASITAAVLALINASPAVATGSPFLTASTTLNSTGINIVALNSGTGGNALTFSAATTGAAGQLSVTPTSLTNLSGGGIADQLKIYYTSLGLQMTAGTDYPGLPPQFHVALAYWVLGDYWLRKDDANEADRYQARYQKLVARAMAYPLDSDRASVPGFWDEESIEGSSVGAGYNY